ncbi:MAG: outer membrane protein assembly factor BamB [Gammaproteobacteria bacterium]
MQAHPPMQRIALRVPPLTAKPVSRMTRTGSIIMYRALAAACLAVLGCGTVNEEFPDQERRPGAVPANPRVAWHYADSHLAVPAHAGGALFVGGKSLVRLDGETGAVLSRFELEGASKGGWLSPPAVEGEHVVATHTRGIVVCLDATLTETCWEADLGLEPEQEGSRASPYFPGVLEGHVYLLAMGRLVIGLDADTGVLRWRHDAPGNVMMSPATDGERVFFGTSNGSFRALDIQSGALLWDHQRDAEYGWTFPVVADGVVYVGDRGSGNGMRRSDTGKLTTEVELPRSGALNAFDAQSGDYLWGRLFGGTGMSLPHVSGDRVYIGYLKTVMPLRLGTGAFITQAAVDAGSNPFGSPTVIGDSLVFGTLGGSLRVSDRRTSELRWELQIEGHKVGSFVATDDRIYVATGLGLLAIEETPGSAPLPAGSVISWGAD